MSEQQTRRPRPKRPAPSNRRPSNQHRKHAVQFILWKMDGGPLSESVIKKFDEAMQAVMDDHGNMRLLAQTVKV
jgi:hypothetical protein